MFHSAKQIPLCEGLTEVLYVDLTRDDDGSPGSGDYPEVIDVEAYLMDMISRPSSPPVARIKEEPAQPDGNAKNGGKVEAGEMQGTVPMGQQQSAQVSGRNIYAVPYTH